MRVTWFTRRSCRRRRRRPPLAAGVDRERDLRNGCCESVNAADVTGVAVVVSG
jgi:hypothetical protein